MCIAEPTSAPLDLFVEDKNDTSVTIIWSAPEVIGPSGLDGYIIEVCKEGSKFCLTWPLDMTKQFITDIQRDEHVDCIFFS